MLDFLIKNEYTQFLLFLIGSVLFASIFNFILSVYTKRLTKKTESEIDDILLGIITRPIYLFIFFIGIYFAVKKLSILSLYSYQINEVFFVVMVLLSSYLISKVSSFIFGLWLKSKDKYEKTPQLLDKIIAVTIYLIGLIIILAHFNIQTSPLIATLGIGGLAIGLAINKTLTNLFAGIHILSDKPINVGDFIEIPQENIKGYVGDIGWRSTRIKSLAGNIIIVPNLKLAENTIINNYLPQKKMYLVIECGVSYNSDLNKVEKATLEVARYIQKTIKGAIKDYQPSFTYKKFGELNIEFTIILGVEAIADKFEVRHQFIKALMKRYREEEIEISYPARKIYQV